MTCPVGNSGSFLQMEKTDFFMQDPGLGKGEVDEMVPISIFMIIFNFGALKP